MNNPSPGTSSPMDNLNTQSGEFNTEVLINGQRTKVTIKYGHATGPVDDVTISWGNESHNVDFEEEDVIDDHGNEGKDMVFMAMSDDKQWIFMVDVSVEASYDLSGNIQDVDWNSLEIDNVNHIESKERPVDEGTCGHTQTADGKKLKTPGGTKGMSGFNRTNFMRGTNIS